MRLIIILILILAAFQSKAQQNNLPEYEELKAKVLELRTDVDNIQLNVSQSEKRFKRGIAVATIGYSVTIAGGLMLGRKNDELGKALLIAGGVTGVTGTILMVDAFKFLGRIGSSKR